MAKKKKPAVPTCRGCNKPLERATRSRHRVWYVCGNIFCIKNQKQSVRIGGVIIGNKDKE